MKKEILLFALVFLSMSIFTSCNKKSPTENSSDTVKDVEGNVYETVKIGNQIWMAENLKVTHYRNREPIPNVTDSEEWTNLSTGAWCLYENNPAHASTFGPLYNWFVVNYKRNIAPVGWHVPTLEEWITLINYLGGWDVAGGKLKETGTTWYSPNEGATNKSGFFALPGGNRDGSWGDFRGMGFFSEFWTSTQYNSNHAWQMTLRYDDSGITCGNDSGSDRGKPGGYSLRCVRD